MQIATRIQGVTGGGSLDWRAVTAPVPANWSHIDYGNGRWVAIGNGAPSGYSGLAATSTDNGEAWTYTSLPIPSFPVLCFKFFSKVGLFIGMGASVFWTTADGVNFNWYSGPAATGGGNSWQALGEFANRLCALSSYSSTGTLDGFSWSAVGGVSSVAAPSGTQIACGPSVAMSARSSNQYLRTSDGIGWGLVSAATGSFAEADYGLGAFFATGTTAGQFWKSTDAGISSWSLITAPESYGIVAKIKANANAVVAVGRPVSAAVKAAVSLDGNLFAMTGPLLSGHGISGLSANGRRFIGVGYAGATPPYWSNSFHILDIP